MIPDSCHLVLGSRSPRRRELLQLLVPREQIEILPPTDSEEPGFDNLHEWTEIEEQISRIARLKNEAVKSQLQARGETQQTLILTADTVIVAPSEGNNLIVLGQPPENTDWHKTVRDWLHEHLSGRTHWAMTATCLSDLTGKRTEKRIRTEVTFRNVSRDEVEWYLTTGEPQGKAGGYALQGVGSIFVKSIEGSLSNVIGLPLETIKAQFEEWGCHDRIQ